MSRTVRVMLAGVVSAGILVVGAGAAFADSESDYGSDAAPAAPQQPAGGLGGGLVSTDAVTGVLGGLGLGGL
jgi:hypothetical protein